MTMNTEKIVREIIRIPEDLQRHGNKSEYTLLQETGYFEAFDSISEDMIANVLTEQPKYIDQWIQSSDDTPCDACWHFRMNDNKRYEVEYHDYKKHIFKKTEYSDGAKACAAFITTKINRMRTSTRFTRHRKPKKSDT